MTNSNRRTIVEGEEDGSRCVINHDVVCSNSNEVESILIAVSKMRGWTFRRIVEMETLCMTPTSSGAFRAVTGRTYFDGE